MACPRVRESGAFRLSRTSRSGASASLGGQAGVRELIRQIRPGLVPRGRDRRRPVTDDGIIPVRRRWLRQAGLASTGRSCDGTNGSGAPPFQRTRPRRRRGKDLYRLALKSPVANLPCKSRANVRHPVAYSAVASRVADPQGFKRFWAGTWPGERRKPHPPHRRRTFVPTRRRPCPGVGRAHPVVEERVGRGVLGRNL